MGDLDFLSAHDNDQIRKWNQTPTLPMDLCLHELITRQAALTPDDIALCSWDGNMTYLDLDRISTRLGHHLVQEYGVEIESIVGFVFEKSLFAVIASTGKFV